MSFIDDYSRYAYLFLIHEKSQVSYAFNSFKTEVKNQLNKRIKSIKSNHEGEYYSRYKGSGEQRLGPFSKYVVECRIVPRYTLPSSPSMNSMVER